MKDFPNMRTNSWGPPAWFAVNCFLMGYPLRGPTKIQKKIYKNFLTLLGKVLPCNLCRDSYAKFLKELPLTEKVLSGRKKLIKWFFDIHNKVNKKLGCKVYTTKQLNKKYKYFDRFRAIKCSKDLVGCLRSSEKIRVPKRTKVITYVDEQALKLKINNKKKKN